MLLKRDYTPEIMDDTGIHDYNIIRALTELKYINKYLGGNSVTKDGIKILAANNKQKFSVLDAGGGASDVLLSLDINAEINSLDLNYAISLFVKKNSPFVNAINGDALNLPFKPLSFDIVHLSLFLHHFNEEKIIMLLKNFLLLCRVGIVINDLRRSGLAYAGIKIITMLFSKSAMVKNDAPLSVKRAFRKKELIELLTASDINNYIIKRKWAFRWLIVIKKIQEPSN